MARRVDSHIVRRMRTTAMSGHSTLLYHGVTSDGPRLGTTIVALSNRSGLSATTYPLCSLGAEGGANALEGAGAVMFAEQAPRARAPAIPTRKRTVLFRAIVGCRIVCPREPAARPKGLSAQISRAQLSSAWEGGRDTDQKRDNVALGV